MRIQLKQMHIICLMLRYLSPCRGDEHHMSSQPLCGIVSLYEPPTVIISRVIMTEAERHSSPMIHINFARRGYEGFKKNNSALWITRDSCVAMAVSSGDRLDGLPRWRRAYWCLERVSKEATTSLRLERAKNTRFSRSIILRPSLTRCTILLITAARQRVRTLVITSTGLLAVCKLAI